MKSLVAAGLALIATSPALAQQKVELKTDKDKVSYSIGADIGRNFKQQELDVNPEAFAAGLRDGITGAKTQLTDEEMMAAIQALQQQMRAKAMARASAAAEQSKAEGEKNKKEGDQFLADNKKKQGVVTLPSGLQYTVVTEGTGAKPKADSMVKTHYKGTFIDGKEFDSSYKRGEPATFPVNGVIKGWTEALQLMKVGSKWKLFVPSNLAYGEEGAGGGAIAPNSTLIFEVELLAIEK
ncbi:MAG: FKBP-type peptidyl-prolyl cis-trans isomerase [Verrucomicrobiota bacterium]